MRGGGGVALSDDDPLATSTSADSGSGGEASRDDHIHVGLVVTDLAPEDADGTAADAGTSPHGSAGRPHPRSAKRNYLGRGHIGTRYGR